MSHITDLPDGTRMTVETSSASTTGFDSHLDPMLTPMVTRSSGNIPCSCMSSSGRNLIVCIDGTSNQFSEKSSNVVELYSHLVKDAKQLTYYDSGIGTYVKESAGWKSWVSMKALSQKFYYAMDMAIAWNFKNKVLSAYQWLSENYENGDRIFLFGFSRGAYQARVIAGMIHRVGLLHKGNNNQIPFAYELYTQSISGEKRTKRGKNDEEQSNPYPQNIPDGQRGKDAESDGKQKIICDHFKSSFSRDVKVHFVGAWDTVSSIGILRGRSLPETNTGMQHVCAFRHALALDERRVKFLPEFANGGNGPGKGDAVKEVWFAGSHSDIGGGNTENVELNRFGPALRWMVYEAMSYGAEMQFKQPWVWGELSLTNSMTGFWRFLEFIPFSRLSYKNMDSVTWTPHCAKPRRLQENQRIHSSVFRSDDEYKTRARLPSSAAWNQQALKEKDMIEKDPYAEAGDVFNKLSESGSELTEADYSVLDILSSSNFGRQSISEIPEALNVCMYYLRAECYRPSPESHRLFISLTKTIVIFEASPIASRLCLKAVLQNIEPFFDRIKVNRTVINQVRERINNIKTPSLVGLPDNDKRDLSRIVDLQQELTYGKAADAANVSQKIGHLSDLALILLLQFGYGQDHKALERMNKVHQDIIGLSLSEVRVDDKRTYLAMHESTLQGQYEKLIDARDFDGSVILAKYAAGLFTSDDYRKPEWLIRLSIALKRRFEVFEDDRDISEAISVGKEALRVELAAHENPNKHAYLANLALAIRSSFDRRKEKADIDDAVTYAGSALGLTPEGHADRASRLTDYAMILWSRFEFFGDSSDIDNAVNIIRQAIDLTPNDRPEKHARRADLVAILDYRFCRLTRPADINDAFNIAKDVLDNVPDNHADEPSWLIVAASVLGSRFKHLGGVFDIDVAVGYARRAVAQTPRDSFDKPLRLAILVGLLRRRFDRLDRIADLEEAISCAREAIDLIPERYASKPALLADLANMLDARFKRTKNIADVKTAVDYASQALDLTPYKHANRQDRISNLANILRSRDNPSSETRIASQPTNDIGLDPSNPTAIECNRVASQLYAQFERYPRIVDLEAAIFLAQQALEHTPKDSSDQPTRLVNCARMLQSRFIHFKEMADLDVAIEHTEKAISLVPNEYSDKHCWHHFLALSFKMRFDSHGQELDLLKAITCAEEAVTIASDKRPETPAYLMDLAAMLCCRFDHVEAGVNIPSQYPQQDGVSTTDRGAEGSVSHGTLNSLPVQAGEEKNGAQIVASAQAAPERKPVSPEPCTTSDSAEYLDKAIISAEKAIRLTSATAPPFWLSTLGELYLKRFDHRTTPNQSEHEAEDIHQAISSIRKAVKQIPDSNEDKPKYLNQFALALLKRFQSQAAGKATKDIKDALQSAQRAVDLCPDASNQKLQYQPDLQRIQRVYNESTQKEKDPS